MIIIIQFSYQRRCAQFKQMHSIFNLFRTNRTILYVVFFFVLANLDILIIIIKKEFSNIYSFKMSKFQTIYRLFCLILSLLDTKYSYTNLSKIYTIHSIVWRIINEFLTLHQQQKKVDLYFQRFTNIEI